MKYGNEYRQRTIENEMQTLGQTNVTKAVQAARENEQESRTDHARHLMAKGIDGQPGMIESFGAALEKFVAQSKVTPGRKHSLVPVLEQFDSVLVPAFITVKVVFDSMIKRKDLTRVSVLVGAELEDELRFKKFETENPAFWNKLIKDLNKREHNLQRRRGILIHEMQKDSQNNPKTVWESWTDAERLTVGLKCIELLSTSTDLIALKQVKERKKLVGKIVATEKTVAWINEFIAEGGIISPYYLPTLVKPKDWDCPSGGGYHFLDSQLRVVKVFDNHKREYLSELAQQPEQMRHVYAALNAVQSTPWRINRKVYEVMAQARESKLEIGKAPICVALLKDKKSKAVNPEMEAAFPMPPKPVDIENNHVARKEWSRLAAKVWGKRAQTTSRALQHIQLLWLAEKFLDEAAIYFPMQLDFRGRMYAVPANLNPQGNDCAKGLLTFAHAKKLGASGLRWLLIHAANMWGEDKISFDNREQWSLDNLNMMLECAYRPFEHREWMQADKPWQFLAVCFELSSAYNLDEPTEYVSSLPVTVDGTCNGLQHFSAMLLDEIGAEAVNLKPNELPQDIYQRVADRVRERLQHEAALGDPMAAMWLAWGFDRKSTKRAVMIVPYSGTRFAAEHYIADYVQGRTECPFEVDQKQAVRYFTAHVWEAIAETVVSARKVMGWLQKIARVVTKNEKPMRWVTPMRFPVRQAYFDMEQYVVDTRVGDRIRYRPTLQRQLDTLDNRRAAQGISPNFIHSLDAASLMLTVNSAVDHGITDFAMVHDSYGVLAADMDQLYVGLRQAFVDIYQHDVLAEFYNVATAGLSEEDRASIPAAPLKGNFCLESVKDSKYFFA